MDVRTASTGCVVLADVGVVCRAGEHKTVKGWSGPTRFAGVGYSVKIARGVDWKSLIDAHGKPIPESHLEQSMSLTLIFYAPVGTI